MKRYKPKPKYKIFTPKWYNIFFWLYFLLSPFTILPIMYIIKYFKEMIEYYSETFHNIFKEWDMR